MLHILEKIVTRSSEKKYALTKLGQEIYKSVSQDPSLARQSIDRMIKRRSPFGVAQGVFVPRSLIFVWTSTRGKSAVTVAAISALVLACLYAADDDLVLFSFSPAGGPILPAATYLGSVAVVSGLAFLSTRFLFRERSDFVVLVAGVTLAFLPLAVFGLLLHYLQAAGALGALGDRTVLTIAFAVFQTWGAGIVGAGMSVASGLRIEKTLVVSLMLLYATMIIVFIQGGVLS